MWVDIPRMATQALFAMNNGGGSARSRGSSVNSPRNGRGTPRGAPAVIDAQRHTNISIGLTKLKSFPSFQAVVSAMLRLDTSALPSTTADMLVEIMPKDNETKGLRRYRPAAVAAVAHITLPSHGAWCGVCRFAGSASDLSSAERWLLVVIGVPRFRAKLDAFRLVTTFEQDEHFTSTRLRTLQGACRQVMASERLKAVLAAVLAIGNFLNQGTRKGSAQGFKLDSLAALTTTRAKDKSTTVLDVLVSTVDKKGGAKLTAFVEDLSLVRAHMPLPCVRPGASY